MRPTLCGVNENPGESLDLFQRRLRLAAFPSGQARKPVLQIGNGESGAFARPLQHLRFDLDPIHERSLPTFPPHFNSFHGEAYRANEGGMICLSRLDGS